jgi:sulfatase modifying factor 1
MKRNLIGIVGILIGCSATRQEKIENNSLLTDTVAPQTTAQIDAAPITNCPSDMVEVKGNYCPVVEEVCLQWVDSHGQPFTHGEGVNERCGEWKYPTKCLSFNRVSMHYCIDRYEYPNVAGQRPQSWMTWYDAKKTLEFEGKRLCTQSEWTFACEGNGGSPQPYPYGNGYVRDRTACNFDLHVSGVDVFKSKRPGDATSQILDSLLVPSGSMPRCVSPFGVYDMVGNLDEWVVNQSGGPFSSGLMSGHVWGVRNRCRAQTTAHGPTFGWYETSTRGCQDVDVKSQ